MIKTLTCSVGELGLIPGTGGSPGGGNANPLQYSHLGNPMDRGAWRAIEGRKESDTTELLTHTTVNGMWIFLVMNPIHLEN